MLYLTNVKKFYLGKSSTWSITWSSVGNFLISCGADGIVFVWGRCFSRNIKKSCKKSIIDKYIFQNWNCLEFFRTNEKSTTIRTCAFSQNFYEISLCYFNGENDMCQILFLNAPKSFSIYKSINLIGPRSEIKSCEFSPNGSIFSISLREKLVWSWVRKESKIFEHLFILGNHESDIKRLKWHPFFGFILTATYDGIFRMFQKKKNEIILNFSFKFSSFSILCVKINEEGRKSMFCNSKGEFFSFPILMKKSNKYNEPIKRSKKKNFSSFCRNSIQSFDSSAANSFLSIAGDDDSLNIVKRTGIWAKEKIKKNFYKNSKNEKILNLDFSIPRAHSGNITDIVWHPKFSNILASSGDDSSVKIWVLSDN